VETPNVLHVPSLVKWFLGAVVTVLWCGITVVVAPFNRTGRPIHWLMRHWTRWCLAVAGLRVEVQGTENVVRDEPYVYVANHQGQADILVLGATIPFPYLWVAKKEMFRIPLLGFCMRIAGCIRLDRTNPEKAILGMGNAAEKLREGRSIVMFPEGTRSPDGQLKPFKRGAFYVALETGVSILPIAIDGSYDVLPKGSMKINSKTIQVRFLAPIPTRGRDLKQKEELQNEVWGILHRSLGSVTK
jgi:1-acyl-sn-glycerol-3-phosphate acyltransferase